MEQQEKQGTAPSVSQRITLEQTRHFIREGFEGFDYGDGSMLIRVHGNHPKKRIDAGERKYTVAHIEGKGEFTLNGETNLITQGDKYIIPAGSDYSYHGENMVLIEENSEGTTSTTLDTK
jgi:hypothetical protein